MITDHTLDQTLIELARTLKALKALRAARKGDVLVVGTEVIRGGWSGSDQAVEHAAALRASMDLTRKLADLRQGR